MTNDAADMSEAEFAAVDFEPWVHTPDEWTPPSNVEWAALANPHLVTIRIAWLIMHKSKTELIEMIEGLERDVAVEMLDRLLDTSRWIKGLHCIADGALARMMCAGLAAGDPRA